MRLFGLFSDFRCVSNQSNNVKNHSNQWLIIGLLNGKPKHFKQNDDMLDILINRSIVQNKQLRC